MVQGQFLQTDEMLSPIPDLYRRVPSCVVVSPIRLDRFSNI